MQSQEYLFVTLIVPVRNESCFITKTLNALVAQDYPHQYVEILIADGRSTDDTRDQIMKFSDEHSTPMIRVIDNPKMSMPAGFNCAAREAKGDTIIMVGGHCEIAFDYVSRCTEALQQTGADCVGGTTVTLGETDMARSIAAAQSSLFGVGGVSFRMKNAKAGFVDTIAFGAYKRSVFDKIGLLDEELVRNQDDEFNFRLTQAGGRIWLDPSIQSVYYSRASLRPLWKQYFDYGFYKVRVIQKRGAVLAWRHLVPGTFVAILMLSVVLFLVSGYSIWLLPALAYILVNGIASLAVARHEWRLLPYLPASFTVLHFAYGLGFLSGLWHWRRYGSLFSSSKKNHSATTMFK